MSYYFFVETAFHHEGDKKYLFKLIDEAKKSGVMGVKFQVLIDLDEFMSPYHSAYNEVKKWIFSFNDWKEIFSYTLKNGLDIIFMPLDIKAFDLIKEFDVKYVELHSVLFNDIKLLNKLEKIKSPLIFGIGGRTLGEIDDIVKRYSDREIVLMVGFQSYPSDLKDIKLERIRELKKMYPDCLIGYADHSSYKSEMCILSNEYAYILGARFFEKHITLNEGIKRVDFESAVSCDKIKIIKKRLDYLETIMNIDQKEIFSMNYKELTYRNRQKVPVAKRNIKAGEIVTLDMIAFKMINHNDVFKSVDEIIGRKVSKNIEKDKGFVKGDFL